MDWKISPSFVIVFTKEEEDEEEEEGEEGEETDIGPRLRDSGGGDGEKEDR